MGALRPGCVLLSVDTWFKDAADAAAAEAALVDGLAGGGGIKIWGQGDAVLYSHTSQLKVCLPACPRGRCLSACIASPVQECRLTHAMCASWPCRCGARDLLAPIPVKAPPSYRQPRLFATLVLRTGASWCPRAATHCRRAPLSVASTAASTMQQWWRKRSYRMGASATPCGAAFLNARAVGPDCIKPVATVEYILVADNRPNVAGPQWRMPPLAWPGWRSSIAWLE